MSKSGIRSGKKEGGKERCIGCRYTLRKYCDRVAIFPFGEVWNSFLEHGHGLGGGEGGEDHHGQVHCGGEVVLGDSFPVQLEEWPKLVQFGF